jgi:hypothetical protein
MICRIHGKICSENFLRIELCKLVFVQRERKKKEKKTLFILSYQKMEGCYALSTTLPISCSVRLLSLCNLKLILKTLKTKILHEDMADCLILRVAEYKLSVHASRNDGVAVLVSKLKGKVWNCP